MDEQTDDLLAELITLCESNLSDDELVEKLSDYHEKDIADVFPMLTDSTRKRLTRILPPAEISDIFSYLENAEDYIERMDADRAADIIESMDADDAVDLLDELNEDTRSEIIERMNDEAVEDINLISSYDDDAVGSRMTTNFIIIKSDMSIKQAMRTVIDQAADNDNVSTIYIENELGEYCGAIDLRDLIVARKDANLSDLIMTSYPSVDADESIEECIERLKDYGEDSIPVLGKHKEVLGVITSTDLVEAVDEQLGEDYAKLAGLTAEEDLQEPLRRSIKKRLPWLLALFFLGLGVSTVVGLFRNVISSLAIIVSFQSLVLDMSGNGGTQSLAVTIRVISDEQVKGKTVLKHILKELRIGMVNGLILSILSCVIAGSFIMLTEHASAAYAFSMSGCIGLALMLAMTLSSLFGTVIPLFFKKIKVDPAVASGPLITTINDLVAVVTYYGLAWLLLIQVLGI